MNTVDVCVVGAGFAGLAAARHLLRAGRSVVLLEARDRVGGRVHSQTTPDGLRLDVGGTWIGVGHDALMSVVTDYGLQTYPTYADGKTTLLLDGKVDHYAKLPRVDPLALLGLGLAIKRLTAMCRELPLDAPWDAPRAQQWDAQTVEGWLSSFWNVPSVTARRILRAILTVESTGNTAETSMLGLLTLLRGSGSFEYMITARGGNADALVDGTMHSVADRMAAELGDRLHLSRPVRRIVQDDDGVTVEANGLTVRARRAIVAAPPILASQIHFEPALPVQRAQLLRRMACGSIIRFLAVYDEPFWRQDGLNGESSSPDLPIGASIDQTPMSGSPGVLACYAAAGHAAKMSAMSAAERERIAVDCLAQRFGPKAAKPRHVIQQDWSAEPWSQGGMIAMFRPGVLTTYGQALRPPVGRLHWAGTETATQSHGFIDGAVRSGLRAADEVMAA